MRRRRAARRRDARRRCGSCPGVAAALPAPSRGRASCSSASPTSPTSPAATLDPARVEAMQRALRAELGLDDVVVCPHDDADDCECRKPQPGMIARGRRRLGIDLTRSFTVGDRWRDVEAGQGRRVRRPCSSTAATRSALTSAPDATVVSDCRGGKRVDHRADASAELAGPDGERPEGEDLRRRRRPRAASPQLADDPADRRASPPTRR